MGSCRRPGSDGDSVSSFYYEPVFPLGSWLPLSFKIVPQVIDRALRWTRVWLSAYVGPLLSYVRHRGLVSRLVKRDMVGRTSGTLLGGLWLLCQPALQVLAFWFLLDYILKVRAPGRIVFIDYFLIAMLPWLMLSETLSRNLAVLSEFSPIYQRTVFPVYILPLIPLLMALLVYAPIYALVSAALIGFSGFLKAWLVMGGLAFWLLPFCYLLAMIGLFFRESRQVFPFLLTMVMYVTPILYQPDALPEPLREWMIWNVMADVIALIEGWMHDLPVEWGNVLRPLLVWLLLMPPAWMLFTRAQPHMREEL